MYRLNAADSNPKIMTTTPRCLSDKPSTDMGTKGAIVAALSLSESDAGSEGEALYSIYSGSVAGFDAEVGSGDGVSVVTAPAGVPMNVLRKSATNRENDLLVILPSATTPDNAASTAGATAHCRPSSAKVKSAMSSRMAADDNSTRRSLARFVAVEMSALTGRYASGGSSVVSTPFAYNSSIS